MGGIKIKCITHDILIFGKKTLGRMKFLGTGKERVMDTRFSGNEQFIKCIYVRRYQ